MFIDGPDADTELQAVIQATIDLGGDPSQFEQNFDLLKYLSKGRAGEFTENAEILIDVMEEIPETFTISLTEPEALVTLIVDVPHALKMASVVPAVVVSKSVSDIGPALQRAVISNEYHANTLVALSNCIQDELDALNSAETPEELFQHTAFVNKYVFDFYWVLYEMEYVYHHYLNEVHEGGWLPVGTWVSP